MGRHVLYRGGNGVGRAGYWGAPNGDFGGKKLTVQQPWLIC